MAKSEIYSWRLDPQTKMALEAEARAKSISLAEMLDQLAQQWLHDGRSAQSESEEAHQARLHSVVAATLGTICGDDASRSENTRELIRQRLQHRAKSAPVNAPIKKTTSIRNGDAVRAHGRHAS